MKLPSYLFGGIVTIYAAGALLNLMGSGMMGTSAQKFAKYITNGYGV